MRLSSLAVSRCSFELQVLTHFHTDGATRVCSQTLLVLRSLYEFHELLGRCVQPGDLAPSIGGGGRWPSNDEAAVRGEAPNRPLDVCGLVTEMVSADAAFQQSMNVRSFVKRCDELNHEWFGGSARDEHDAGLLTFVIERARANLVAQGLGVELECSLDSGYGNADVVETESRDGNGDIVWHHSIEGQKRK